MRDYIRCRLPRLRPALPFPMGILFGLLAAFCWGLGDYLITHLTRRVGTARALLGIQLLSLLSWIVLLLATSGQRGVPSAQAGIWALAAGAGVCHVLGLALTYRAFEIGTLSLVSPIASGFAVVTAALALLSGERPTPFALAGVVLLVLGVVLATRAKSDAEKKTLAGVPEALGSALAFGIMFWMFERVEEGLGGIVWPLIVLKVMASGSALLSVARLVWKPRATPVESPPAQTPASDITASPATASPVATSPVWSASPVIIWALAIGAAATDTLAWLAYTEGIDTQYVTIVTALASLFSVVTILLAWALLRERLAPNQWAGVAIILLGVFFVSGVPEEVRKKLGAAPPEPAKGRQSWNNAKNNAATGHRISGRRSAANGRPPA